MLDCRSSLAPLLLATWTFAQQFEEARRQDLPQPITTTAAIHDWNGDGVPDLIHYDANNARFVALNDGAGVFTDVALPGSSMPPALNEVMCAAGDIDNDGVAELYEVAAGTLTVLTATGATMSQPGGLECLGIEIADLDADGFGDVITLHHSAVRIYWGSAAGLTANPTLFFMNVWRGWAIGDLDDDGDLDIVLPNGGGVDYLRNDGNQVLSLQPTTVPGGDWNGAIVADFDADGTPDLLLKAGTTGPTDASLLRGLGGGAFAAPANLSLVGSTGVIAGDVDGDGDLDLVAHAVGDRLRTMINDGGGNFTVTQDLALFGFSRPEALRDLDGDGDADLIGRDWLSLFGAQGSTPALRGSLLLAANDGAGSFLPYSREPAPLRNDMRLVADFDGDGVPDVMTRYQILLGNALGGYRERWEVPIAVSSTLTPYAFDMDGDGDLDLLSRPAPGHVWINAGGGNWSQGPALDLGLFPLIRRLHAADVDGDGDVDVFAADPAALFLRTGATFTAASLPAVACSNLMTVDVDNDGDVDLVTNQPSVLINDGSGNFTNQSNVWLPPGLPGPSFFETQFATADLDGNGLPDLLIHGRWLQNQATGFVDVTAQWAPSTPCSVTAFADFDEDGAPDALALCGSSLTVLQNSGTGAMTVGAALIANAAAEWSSPFAVDVDRDGDIDVLVPGVNVARLFANTQRHLLAERSAVLGQTWSIDAYARPNAPVGDLAIVAASTGRLPAPIVLPQGNTWLDPTGLVVLAFAPIPGTLQVPLPIPATPGLFGFELFVQGWMLPNDNRFTNVLSERLR